MWKCVNEDVDRGKEMRVGSPFPLKFKDGVSLFDQMNEHLKQICNPKFSSSRPEVNECRRSDEDLTFVRPALVTRVYDEEYLDPLEARYPVSAVLGEREIRKTDGMFFAGFPGNTVPVPSYDAWLKIGEFNHGWERHLEAKYVTSLIRNYEYRLGYSNREIFIALWNIFFLIPRRVDTPKWLPANVALWVDSTPFGLGRQLGGFFLSEGISRVLSLTLGGTGKDAPMLTSPVLDVDDDCMTSIMLTVLSFPHFMGGNNHMHTIKDVIKDPRILWFDTVNYQVRNFCYVVMTVMPPCNVSTRQNWFVRQCLSFFPIGNRCHYGPDPCDYLSRAEVEIVLGDLVSRSFVMTPTIGLGLVKNGSVFGESTGRLTAINTGVHLHPLRYTVPHRVMWVYDLDTCAIAYFRESKVLGKSPNWQNPLFLWQVHKRTHIRFYTPQGVWEDEMPTNYGGFIFSFCSQMMPPVQFSGRMPYCDKICIEWLVEILLCVSRICPDFVTIFYQNMVTQEFEHYGLRDVASLPVVPFDISPHPTVRRHRGTLSWTFQALIAPAPRNQMRYVKAPIVFTDQTNSFANESGIVHTPKRISPNAIRSAGRWWVRSFSEGKGGPRRMYSLAGHMEILIRSAVRYCPTMILYENNRDVFVGGMLVTDEELKELCASQEWTDPEAPWEVGATFGHPVGVALPPGGVIEDV